MTRRDTPQSERRDTCIWKKVEPPGLGDEYWDTECGNSYCFPDGGTPEINHCSYCQYCGGEIHVSEK